MSSHRGTTPGCATRPMIWTPFCNEGGLDLVQADDVQEDGVQEDGVKADGVQADGVQADGVQADGVQADGGMVQSGYCGPGRYICSRKRLNASLGQGGSDIQNYLYCFILYFGASTF